METTSRAADGRMESLDGDMELAFRLLGEFSGAVGNGDFSAAASALEALTAKPAEAPWLPRQDAIGFMALCAANNVLAPFEAALALCPGARSVEGLGTGLSVVAAEPRAGEALCVLAAAPVAGRPDLLARGLAAACESGALTCALTLSRLGGKHHVDAMPGAALDAAKRGLLESVWFARSDARQAKTLLTEIRDGDLASARARLRDARPIAGDAAATAIRLLSASGEPGLAKAVFALSPLTAIEGWAAAARGNPDGAELWQWSLLAARDFPGWEAWGESFANKNGLPLAASQARLCSAMAAR